MNCFKCGCGLDSGKDFIPVEPKGIPGRKWACIECANLVQRQSARNLLGKDGLEVARIFNPAFLK